MNRRIFTTSLCASAAIGHWRSRTLQHVAAQTTLLSVSTTWKAARGSGNGIDLFVTTITVRKTEDAANDAFDTLLDEVQVGTLYNEETQAETVGDDSFFVRYSDPNFVVDELVVRIGPLIYQFRSEALQYGGARDAYRLMEEVFGRADRSVTSEKTLTALLPTKEEVAVYGLTEQVETQATPAT